MADGQRSQAKVNGSQWIENEITGQKENEAGGGGFLAGNNS